ncbi:histidinol dehydrogenase [candidate division KSB1 bacterium]|nr:histidinol dehydrogenase [candidate division KSB1 bacterium]
MQYLKIKTREDLHGLNALFLESDSASPEIAQTVQHIIAEVQREGDAACLRFTREFDGVTLARNQIEVTRQERAQAQRRVPRALLDALAIAAENIRFFHEKQRMRDWRAEREGVVLEQRYLPIGRVGMYVPGGRAKYPSTVLMTAIPAQIAGVEEIIMVSPPDRETRTIAPVLLAAAEIAGVHRIFRIGGAQAIAALAYGTATIPAVDKIVGPGNAYVAEAKRQVFGKVGIDMLAGPTEVVLLIDATAPVEIVAQDMFAQMEHDPATRATVISVDAAHLQKIIAFVEQEINNAPRAEILRQAWAQRTFLIQTEDEAQACEAANALAPEHLQIMTREPRAFLRHIRNAGAIFLGRYSPVAMGDYIAGPNHTLPTNGSARFASPLGVHDFMRQQHVVEYSHDAWQREKDVVATLAEAEQLFNHALSVKQRG